jgi:hypothetical protein
MCLIIGLTKPAVVYFPLSLAYCAIHHSDGVTPPQSVSSEDSRILYQVHLRH